MTSSANLHALETLELSSAPVAIAFLNTPPNGMSRINRAAPAGCSYWRLASEGQAFYTTTEDHQNCPVGALTHAVPLTPEKSSELQSLIGTMIELRYLRSDEIPAIPHRTEPMQIAAYAPLQHATFPADVIVFRGNARQIMLLSEAARAAGSFESGTAMGRPACAMLPQALGAATSIASIACIGNRVYTDLGDDELYLAVPGKTLDATLEQLETIIGANAELEKFHVMRKTALSLAATSNDQPTRSQ